MISCAEAVNQLWELLDGALVDEDRSRMEEHLAFCRRCCGELEFAEELQAFLASQPPDAMPPAVRGRMDAYLDGLGGDPVDTRPGGDAQDEP